MMPTNTRSTLRRLLLATGSAAAIVLAGCQSNGQRTDLAPGAKVGNADDLLVVDCLLPGQIRKLGSNLTFVAPRKAIKTSGTDCEIRGGEYVAYDRADYRTALRIWLPAAKEGDADAQVYVGEIYEKGLGLEADYQTAMAWYRKAAEQGNTRALINLGYLYESGLGVERNLTEAMNWYRKASGLNDGQLEFVSSVEMANRKAVKAEHASLKQEVGKLRGQLKTAENRLASSRRSLAAKEQRVQALRKVAKNNSASTPKATPVVVRDEQLVKQLESAQEDRRRLLAQLADTQADSEKMRASLTEQEAELQEKKRELQIAQRDLDITRQKLLKAQTEGSAATSIDTDELQQRYEKTSTQLASDRQELTRLTKRLANTQLEKSQLLNDLNAREAEYARTQEKLASLLEGQGEYEEMRVLLAESQQERLRLTSQLAEVQIESAQLRQRVPQVEAELEARKSELATSRAAVDQLRTTLNQLRSAQRSSDSDEIGALAAALQQKEESLADTQQQVSALEQELSQQRGQSSRALADAQQREQDYKQQVAQREKTIQDLKAKLAPALSQSSELKNVRTQLDKADAQRLSLTKQLAEQNVAYADLQEQLATAQKVAATRDRDLAKSRETITLLQTQLSESEASLASSSTAIEGLKKRLAQKSQELEDRRREVEQLEAEQQRNEQAMQRQLVDAQQNQSTLSESVESQQSKIKQLESRLTVMQDSLEASESKNAQLDVVESQLETEQAKVVQREKEIQRLLTKISAAEQAISGPKSTSVVTTSTDGPTIEIIEPPLAVTRGAPSVLLRSPTKSVDVVGRVSPEKGLVTFKINDRSRTLSGNGLFRESLSLQGTRTPVNIVAVDELGNRTALDFYVIPPSAKKAKESSGSTGGATPPSGGDKVDFGRYHALVIGNQEYTKMQKLKTPENDARELASVLESKYGFETTLLLNATRYQILSALNNLRATLTEKDNLLIFYAGHGELDNVNLRGHWLPVDAEPDSSANWISNVAVTDILNAMSAKHVLVIADSCYSGAMTRSSVARLETGMSKQKKDQWYEIMAGARARAVLTSGGLQPVLDSGGGDHSIFTAALLDVLRNNDGILEGYSLYRKLQSRVKNQAARLNVEQDPQYAPIKFAGHEAGEFFFLPRRGVLGVLDQHETRVAAAK
ncbi:caspase family protein [Thiosocius teredinicola]|uniref:caspase family protein n=1 Tax=Thiosocius teredinicola TaxID=1973002 RepID=UPI000990EE75